MGLDAVLVEVGGLAEAMALHARLAASSPPGVIDVVPAAATVLVRVDRAVVTLDAVRAWVAASVTGTGAPPAPPVRVSLPIRYDGADLDDLAAMFGSSREALAARHAATDWTVAFTGFAPGFGYLIGAGWDLDVPRRRSPRTRVPPGSVALAGVFSGAYPRETPGGWQLVGTTDAALFDPDAAQPALLVPGAPVRFEPLRPRSVAARRDAARPAPAPAPARVPALRGIRIASPGVQATLQDGGRPGRAAAGIGVAGAADPAAWALGNRLLGNGRGAAAIEVAVGGFRAVAERDLSVVVTGAWAPVVIGGRASDPYVVHAWPAGTELRLDGFLGGARAYLAVRGGWDLAPVLGSRSTDTLSGLGPAPLQAGDVVPVGDDVEAPVPALPLHPWGPPQLGTEAAPLEIPFVPGPRDDWLSASSRRLLAEETWAVSAAADRVGIRLDGPHLERARLDELASEGMVPGAIQVPPSGQPVVFGVDAPVTGGYPVVGVVSATGRSRLAQALPGARVRLRPIPGGARTADDR